MGLALQEAIGSFSYTHQGKVRQENQDALYCDDDNHIWVVADGMGGHTNGAQASKSVISAVSNTKATPHFGANVRRLTQQIKSYSDRYYSANAGSEQTLSGSTAMCVHARGPRMCAIWLGDSRLYRLRNNRLQLVTKDHSHPSQGSSMHSSPGGTLTRAFGAQPNASPETTYFGAQSGDKYLLCTDGLTKEASFDDLEKLLQPTAPASTLGRSIVQHYQSGKARDNLALILVCL